MELRKIAYFCVSLNDVTSELSKGECDGTYDENIYFVTVAISIGTVFVSS